MGLLKMYVEADVNSDGLVSRAGFSKLVDAAAAIPREFGYAPKDEELYKSQYEKDSARQKMFDSMDLKATGVITFDEWLKFAMEHIEKKVATLAPHPILNHGNVIQFTAFIKKALVKGSPEYKELYWYLLEIFTDNDNDKDGNVTMRAFPEMVDKLVSLPTELGIMHEVTDLFTATGAQRAATHRKLFKQYNTRGDGSMSWDEWLNLSLEVIFKKMIL